jgi:ABC-2 type transport system permease protein
LACWGYTLVLFGDAHTLGFVLQNLLLALFFFFCLTVTLVFSSLMKSRLAAGGLALAFIIFLSVISALPWIGRFLPGALLSWGNHLVLGQPGGSEWGALVVTAGLIGLGIYLTWANLRKKEL